MNSVSFYVRRIFEWLTFRRRLINISLVADALLILPLVACVSSSNASKDFYILSLSYRNLTKIPSHGSNLTLPIFSAAKEVPLEVRAGYFSLCVSRQDTLDWTCGRAPALRAVADGENDPLDLIGIAEHFSDGVIFPGLLITCIIFSLFAFAIWQEKTDVQDIEEDIQRDSAGTQSEEQGTQEAQVAQGPQGNKQSRRMYPPLYIMQSSLGAIFGAMSFALMSALWQHMAASVYGTIAGSMTYQVVQGKVGPAAAAFLWSGFLLLAFVTVGLIVVILDIISGVSV
ncbi:uncharacterized protein K452DRAFT_361382 [Aplosporella prunicola CBS 121167]|uniref:Uncharacterized protein n=1 Tax=Aplosporella prunicola CBS 121167 TaxID=1176127 RepID=A0A6A6B2N5_9PEZI|nr:uncharacterized protein K452DRAFT_361382 [Aplosporella prunicola CBS 121167]KAF2138310.1 hypothetical protein K452DRAFT_361382 [Aplosporella prunicola CBS 121167]